jgi:hypothetical protein
MVNMGNDAEISNMCCVHRTKARPEAVFELKKIHLLGAECHAVRSRERGGE